MELLFHNIRTSTLLDVNGYKLLLKEYSITLLRVVSVEQHTLTETPPSSISPSGGRKTRENGIERYPVVGLAILKGSHHW